MAAKRKVEPTLITADAYFPLIPGGRYLFQIGGGDGAVAFHTSSLAASVDPSMDSPDLLEYVVYPGSTGGIHKFEDSAPTSGWVRVSHVTDCTFSCVLLTEGADS